MPPPLIISSVTPGQDPDPATASTSWAFTSNGNSDRTLTASLDVAPPDGMTITVDLGTAESATTHGNGSSAGSSTIATLSNATYQNVTLWSGARRARANGTVAWTAAVTAGLTEDDSYTGNLTLTFE